ncbi:hypothetical protein G9A89_015821 [Geosiphon pyriformis]|nr:hypothetical protein G9A89_015821 [Geosiphon pyriformis]
MSKHELSIAFAEQHRNTIQAKRNRKNMAVSRFTEKSHPTAPLQTKVETKSVMKSLRNLTGATNDEEAIKQIINELKTFRQAEYYPSIMNFYMVTSALSKLMLILQGNTNLRGGFPIFSRNEKISFMNYEDETSGNHVEKSLITSRRRSRNLRKSSLISVNEKLTSIVSEPNINQLQIIKVSELEHPLVIATHNVVFDTLCETDNIDKVSSRIRELLESSQQRPESLFDILFVQQRQPKSSALLGICDFAGIGTRVNVQQAFESFENSAIGGDNLGQYLLALCFFYGIGVNNDFEKAFYWFEKSAQGGNPLGQSAAGLCYFKGCGVTKDDRKAFQWYAESSMNGSRMKNSATSSETVPRFGFGTARDQEKIFHLHQTLANSGNADGQCVLGHCYLKGIGTNQDLNQAFSWYLKSAEAGSMYGQFNLATCYEYGLGTSVNLPHAIRWYQAALITGYDNAAAPLERLLTQRAAKCCYL